MTGGHVGGLRSRRRGTGSDVTGSRPYQPGDDLRRIDRHASARLSSASGRDEWVVREYFAEESARVVVAVDRRPTMRLFPQTLPWLHKPAAVASAVTMIVDSAREAGCTVALADPDDGGASDDALLRPLAELRRGRRRLPPGSFVFLLSDFLTFPPRDAWATPLASDWEIVPVLLQDPVWEQSFPDIGSAVLPLADPSTGGAALVRVRRGEARARKEEHERRLATTLAEFAGMGLASLLLSTDEPAAIHRAFLAWAHERTGRDRWRP